MPRSVLILTAALALVGCRASGNVWLIEVNTQKGNGYSCTESSATNYAGELAGETESSGPVTDTYESMGSNILFYVKLVDLEKGTGTLNSGDLLLPGKEGDKGEWSFEWTNADAHRTRKDHDGGYTLETIVEDSQMTGITLNLDGDTATGEMTIEEQQASLRGESDTWSEAVAEDIGSYGELSWNTADDGWTSNTREESDCTGDPCRVETSEVCGASAPLTATRTDISDEGDYSSLARLVQYGSFKTSSSWSYGGDSGGGWDSGDWE